MLALTHMLLDLAALHPLPHSDWLAARIDTVRR